MISNKNKKDRATVNLVDVVVTTFVLVGLLVLAPYFYKFIGMVSEVADPFSSMLLQLIVPMLFIGLVVSVGISAKRSV